MNNTLIEEYKNKYSNYYNIFLNIDNDKKLYNIILLYNVDLNKIPKDIQQNKDMIDKIYNIIYDYSSKILIQIIENIEKINIIDANITLEIEELPLYFEKEINNLIRKTHLEIKEYKLLEISKKTYLANSIIILCRIISELYDYFHPNKINIRTGIKIVDTTIDTTEHINTEHTKPLKLDVLIESCYDDKSIELEFLYKVKILVISEIFNVYDNNYYANDILYDNDNETQTIISYDIDNNPQLPTTQPIINRNQITNNSSINKPTIPHIIDINTDKIYTFIYDAYKKYDDVKLDIKLIYKKIDTLNINSIIIKKENLKILYKFGVIQHYDILNETIYFNNIEQSSTNFTTINNIIVHNINNKKYLRYDKLNLIAMYVFSKYMLLLEEILNIFIEKFTNYKYIDNKTTKDQNYILKYLISIRENLMKNNKLIKNVLEYNTSNIY